MNKIMINAVNRAVPGGGLLCCQLSLRASAGVASPLMLGKLILAVLLVAWMAVSLSNVFWRLLPQPELKEVELTANSQAFAPTDKAAPAVNIAALKNIPLFGKEVAPAPVEVVKVEKPKELEATKLNLELVGSFASNNQDKAYAIIANGKKQELYRVNEEITGLTNVKLVSVAAERVVINNRGRQEALLMYPEGQPISSGVSVVSSQLTSTPARPTAAAGGTGLAGLNPNQRLEKISDAIRFSRKTRDGQMLGFRVLPGRNRAAFEQTGLKLNDVVTAIDGQVLDNLRAANKIYQEKRNATQASLTVLRGEEELTIDIDLNNINVN